LDISRLPFFNYCNGPLSGIVIIGAGAEKSGALQRFAGKIRFMTQKQT